MADLDEIPVLIERSTLHVKVALEAKAQRAPSRRLRENGCLNMLQQLFSRTHVAFVLTSFQNELLDAC